MVIAGIAFFTIPNLPAKTKWLSERESAIVKDRLMRDSDALELEGRFNWSGVRQAVKDPKVYLYCSLFHGFSFGLYTISLFLPTIIQGLGYGSWQAQLLSVPPYVLAFLAVMTIAWISQRVGIRAPFIIGSALVAIIGYIVLLTSPTIGGKYASTFLIVGGIYSGNGILLAWPSENVAGATKRNTALAMQISLGNVSINAVTKRMQQCELTLTVSFRSSNTTDRRDHRDPALPHASRLTTKRQLPHFHRPHHPLARHRHPERFCAVAGART